LDVFFCFLGDSLRFSRGTVLSRLLSRLVGGMALTVVLFCTGCLDFEQRMTLTEDGAVEVVFDYTVDRSALPVLARFREILQQWQEGRSSAEGVRPNTLAWVFNKPLVRKYLKEADVQLVSYRDEVLKNRRHVRIVCRASDARRAFRSGVLGDFSLRPTQAGNWILEAAGDVLPLTDKDAAAVNENADVVRELCRGVQLRLEIIVPGAIVASSADSFSGRRAVWEIDLGQSRGSKTDLGIKPISVTFDGDRVRWKK